MLHDIGFAMGCDDAYGDAAMFERVFDSLELEVPEANARQYEILRTSVNPIRLRNHPVALDADAIDGLYHAILREA